MTALALGSGRRSERSGLSLRSGPDRLSGRRRSGSRGSGAIRDPAVSRIPKSCVGIERFPSESLIYSLSEPRTRRSQSTSRLSLHRAVRLTRQ